MFKPTVEHLSFTKTDHYCRLGLLEWVVANILQ